jgi:hypothetical protein
MKFKFFSYQPNNILNKITPIYSDIDSVSDYINEFGQNDQNHIKYLKLEDIIPLVFNESKDDKSDEKSFELLYQNKKDDSQSNEKKLSFEINQKESIQLKMRNNIYLKKPFKEKKLIGRKKKSNEGLGEHNKFSDDNLIRRVKNIVLENLLLFINQKIISVYSNDNQNSQNDLKHKQLLKLSQKQVEKKNVEYNKSFLNRTLQSIFSGDISTKYKKYKVKHNQNLIEELLNEQDEEKRLFFQNIFNLSFLDVLKHFRRNIFLKELSEMKSFNDYLNKTDFGNNSKDYKEILIIFMNNYEKIVMEKHSRKGKKQ